jgi:endonuclease/exonuclease/phosphatase family metal-dependent hydrolase
MLRYLLTILFIVSMIITQAQSVKVMTYNIRYATPNDGVNEWSKRASKVYDLIKKYDPDIIGVQEALQSQLEDIVTNLPQYTYVGVGRDDGKTAGEYSAILYRKNKFTITEQNTFWLSETPEVPGSKSWDAAITRIVTWGRFRDKKSSQEFMIINTHFDHKGKEARLESARFLKKKAADLSKGLPSVVMGDLNCKREDPPYSALMSTEGLALTDPAPANPPGTFCSFTVNSIPCNPIDYIFHSSDWRSENYAVIQDNDGTYYPSDHLPVMVTLKKNAGKEKKKK